MKIVGLVFSFLVIFGFQSKGQIDIDSFQLMKDVKKLSSDRMMGRKTGTKGSRLAQFYILQRYREMGLRKLNNTFEQSFFFQREEKRIMGTNLMGYLKGKKDSSWIIISAHYDHLGIGKPVESDSIYNGADDNASGVAGLFAIAHYFKNHPPKHNLLFIAFDAEEEGLRGSKAFIRHSAQFLKQIKLNINLDMISHSDKKELYVSGTHQFPKFRSLLQSFPSDSSIHLLFGHDGQNKKEQNWVNQSDQDSFYKRNIPFLYFGVEDHPDYHQLSDSFSTISPSFYYHAVKTIIEVTEKLDLYLGQKINIPPKSKWIMKN